MADHEAAGRRVLRRRGAVLVLLFLTLALAGGLCLYGTVQLLSRSFQPRPPLPQPPAGAANRDR